MFWTVFPIKIGSSSLYVQQQVYVEQYLFDIYLLLYAQSWTPDDGRNDCLKNVECYSKIK